MEIEKLMNDGAFVEQIKNAKDLAEVAALLQAQGIEVTEEDLKTQLSAEEGELDEASLENVAGGSWAKAFEYKRKSAIYSIKGDRAKAAAYAAKAKYELRHPFK